MPAIDLEKFAFAVAGALERRKLSMAQAQNRYQGVTKGMLSRVKNGIAISAANMLCLCHHLDLNPLDYLDLERANPHSQFGLPHKEKLKISRGSSSCHP